MLGVVYCGLAHLINKSGVRTAHAQWRCKLGARQTKHCTETLSPRE